MVPAGDLTDSAAGASSEIAVEPQVVDEVVPDIIRDLTDSVTGASHESAGHSREIPIEFIDPQTSIDIPIEIDIPI